MISNWVHKVHMQKAADYNDEFEKFTMMCTQVHPTIKRLWRGAKSNKWSCRNICNT